MAMDFPNSPYVGQAYTNTTGTTYLWDGGAWVIQIIDPSDEALLTLNGLLSQIRTLLQDTDLLSGGYRYSTNSIIMALNQGLLEMFRLRPDIFLALGFTVPFFSSSNLGVDIGIEQQWVPPLVYYAVGLVQARDDEQTQDARAAAYLQTFKQTLMTVT